MINKELRDIYEQLIALSQILDTRLLAIDEKIDKLILALKMLQTTEERKGQSWTEISAQLP